jgi:small subunit ribosomal protein S2
MFIGTKKQAQDPVRDFADQCGMPYVNERWLGGMLTNFETISKRVSKMQEYERMKASGEFDAMPKKEALLLGRELDKLQKNLGGIRRMSKLPDAVFVLDTKKEHIAVTEANKLKIPVVAVVDTNVDPDVVQYPIPGNDDAIRANALMARVIAEAIEEGRYVASRRNPQAAAATPQKRTAEEEAEFSAAQAEARRQAAAAQAERDARVAAGAGAAPRPAAAPEPPLDESNSTDAEATVTPGATISEAIAQAEDTDVAEAPHTPIES